MTAHQRALTDKRLPKSEDEARERIIQAAIACVERDGVAGANISTVAKEVGVTRRTIYRLFASSGDLIQTIAAQTTGLTLNRMVAHVNRYATFDERVIEAIIFMTKAIPEDPVLREYFSLERSKSIDIQQAFTVESLAFSGQMLKMIYPAGRKKPDDTAFQQLAEHMQRLILSMILAPGPNLKTDKAKRDYLQRWLLPSLRTF